MSAAPELERHVLEHKERGELHVIAESLGLTPGTRTKKADLIDQILKATGVVMSQVEPSGAGSHLNGANGVNGLERRTEEDDRRGPAGPGSSPTEAAEAAEIAEAGDAGQAAEAAEIAEAGDAGQAGEAGEAAAGARDAIDVMDATDATDVMTAAQDPAPPGSTAPSLDGQPPSGHLDPPLSGADRRSRPRGARQSPRQQRRRR